MIPRHLCFAIALSILIAGCATTPRVFVPGPETNLRPAAETAGVLQNTRLDGGYIYLLPVVDRRKAGPEDFGRSEGTLLALKGASVPELVTQYTAAKLRRAGFSVQVLKPGQAVPKNDKFCPLVLGLTIDRFWVLAEPIAYDGVAERYRYFISLNATMRSPRKTSRFSKTGISTSPPRWPGTTSTPLWIIRPTTSISSGCTAPPCITCSPFSCGKSRRISGISSAPKAGVRPCGTTRCRSLSTSNSVSSPTRCATPFFWGIALHCHALGLLLYCLLIATNLCCPARDRMAALS